MSNGLVIDYIMVTSRYTHRCSNMNKCLWNCSNYKNTQVVVCDQLVPSANMTPVVLFTLI